MSATARVALLLVAACLAGCGSSGPATHATGPARTLSLQAACPSVHVAYDALVASDPESAQAFHESLRRMWEVGVDEMREAVKPLLDASRSLASADRAGFSAARDHVYDAVVRLSATCGTIGPPILH